jgi:hypothetical protein
MLGVRTPIARKRVVRERCPRHASQFSGLLPEGLLVSSVLQIHFRRTGERVSPGGRTIFASISHSVVRFVSW